MNLKPLNGKVILQEWQEPNDKSGILIPAQRQQEKVFEVWDTGGNEGIKEKDKVIIDEYAGKERIINGQKYYFVDFSDLIAKL